MTVDAVEPKFEGRRKVGRGNSVRWVTPYTSTSELCISGTKWLIAFQLQVVKGMLWEFPFFSQKTRWIAVFAMDLGGVDFMLFTQIRR